MINWEQYSSAPFRDELLLEKGKPRPLAEAICAHLSDMTQAELEVLNGECEATARAMGITFPLYGAEGEALERAWPFDPIPRLIALDEWQPLEKGILQRCRGLNAFIQDAYNERRCVSEGLISAAELTSLAGYRPECLGVKPPHGVWAHVVGDDLVRAADGCFYVLEDNLQIPSGASYMIENREVMKRLLPETFIDSQVLSIDHYPNLLFETLASLGERGRADSEVVVLTPGIYNSAYYEHAFLARNMGAELVEGRDLEVGSDGGVYRRNIDGLAQVDVIYRRIDDLFLDPLEFRRDSVLGVPGLMRSWREGKVALANAPGAGIADDKAICARVPEFIRFYLGEEPLINSIPTFNCSDERDLEQVQERLAELVVKPRGGAGGKGVVIGPQTSAKALARLSADLSKNPENYIAQEVISLSTCPMLVGADVAPRHVDLRCFVLCGKEYSSVPGGLTRVAGKAGSLIVNSSQGGSSKDTWVVAAGEGAA